MTEIIGSYSEIEDHLRELERRNISAAELWRFVVSQLNAAAIQCREEEMDWDWYHLIMDSLPPLPTASYLEDETILSR